jgi:hypothetical protein
MSKSSGLAVLALIVALGAMGLGVYQIIFVPTTSPSGIRNTWYDFHYSTVYTNPVSTIIPVDQLLINFTVNSGESVYFHFNTWATVDAQWQGVSIMQFNFVLDGNWLSGPQYPWWALISYNESIQVPVALQMSLDTVTVGAHNASISIFGNDADNEIFSSTLLVQTYIP